MPCCTYQWTDRALASTFQHGAEVLSMLLLQYLPTYLPPPALSNWYVMPSGSMQKEKALERDFISLNKAAVESGLTTASEQSRFRATHDIRRKPADSARAKSEKSIQFPPDMTFGISTRCVHTHV